jgi:hypothetical protein
MSIKGTRISGLGLGAISNIDPATHGSLALSVATARTAELAPGVYRIWASVDCFVKFGDSAVTATTSDMPLTAKLKEDHVLLATLSHIAGIVSSGTGVLFFAKNRG